MFGWTAERKAERAALADYEARIERILPKLTRANLALGAQYASVPDTIRGFGHIKAANIQKAQAQYAGLEAVLDAPAALQATG